MSVARAIAVVLVAVAVGSAGCRPPGDTRSTSPDASGTEASAIDAAATGVTVALEGASARIVGPAVLDVTLVAGGAAVTGANVRVTGDMTHAGMVPVVANATEIEPGTYRTDGFEFTMAGDWILTIDVVLSDGTESTHEVAVRAQRP